MSDPTSPAAPVDLDTYAAWIAANVHGSGLGACNDVTERMVAAFPELTRVRGHYHCPVWGRREHWWCVTAGGVIVDPTAHQFPSRGAGHYEPHVEGSLEPTGKCLGCGEYVWDHRTFCSDACQADMLADIGQQVRRGL